MWQQNPDGTYQWVGTSAPTSQPPNGGAPDATTVQRWYSNTAGLPSGNSFTTANTTAASVIKAPTGKQANQVYTTWGPIGAGKSGAIVKGNGLEAFTQGQGLKDMGYTSGGPLDLINQYAPGLVDAHPEVKNALAAGGTLSTGIGALVSALTGLPTSGGDVMSAANAPGPAGYGTPMDVNALGTALLFNPTEFENVKSKLQQAGLLPKKVDAVTVQQAYENYVLQGAMNAQANGQKGMTPDAYLNHLVTLSQGAGIAATPVGAGGDGTITTIYQINPDEAQLKLRNAMQQWLGRDPTDHEMTSFINAVNTNARQNPSITTRSGATGNVEKDVTKGFSPLYTSENMALSDAKNSPDFAPYQAVSTYYNALQQDLGAAVSGIGHGF